MAKWNIGPKNGMWKGGRSVASNGYVLIRVGKDHHLADVRGYAYEHRLIAEKKLGRKLRKGELGHHDNEIKTDNRPSNIIPTTRRRHLSLHRKPGSKRRLPGQRNPFVKCKCGCGQQFRRFDAGNRPRIFVSGHNIHPHGRTN